MWPYVASDTFHTWHLDYAPMRKVRCPCTRTSKFCTNAKKLKKSIHKVNYGSSQKRDVSGIQWKTLWLITQERIGVGSSNLVTGLSVKVDDGMVWLCYRVCICNTLKPAMCTERDTQPTSLKNTWSELCSFFGLIIIIIIIIIHEYYYGGAVALLLQDHLTMSVSRFVG